MIFASAKLGQRGPDFHMDRRPSVEGRLHGHQLPSLTHINSKTQIKQIFEGDKRQKTELDTEEAATTFVTNLM